MAGPTGGAAEIARAVEITAEVPQIEGTWRDWRRFPYWLVGIAAILVWIAYLVITQERYQRRVGPDRSRHPPDDRSDVLGVLDRARVRHGPRARAHRAQRRDPQRRDLLHRVHPRRADPRADLHDRLRSRADRRRPRSASSATSVDFKWRAIIALALIYAAYLAEVLRAGIESISKGQTEAGRALGHESRPDAAPHRVAAGGP